MSSYDWVAAATSAAAAHISAAASPTAAAAAAAAAADAAAPRATAAVAASGVPPAIASAVCRGGRGDLVHHQPVPLEAVKARKVPLTHGAVEGAPLLVHRLDMLRQVAALREEPAALLFGALKRSKLEMHHPVVLLEGVGGVGEGGRGENGERDPTGGPASRVHPRTSETVHANKQECSGIGREASRTTEGIEYHRSAAIRESIGHQECNDKDCANDEDTMQATDEGSTVPADQSISRATPLDSQYGLLLPRSTRE